MIGDYWIVVCPMGGREEAAKKFLGQFGIECYVPMGTHITKPKRKKQPVVVQRVVFPGYAFVKIDAENPCWGTIERCPDILSTIVFEHRGEMVVSHMPQSVIEIIRANEEAGFYNQHQAEKPSFNPGTSVHIASGIMEGMDGTVIRQAGGGRLMVEISGRPITLPLDFLMPVVL